MKILRNLTLCLTFAGILSFVQEASAAPPSRSEVVRALMVVSSPVDTAKLKKELPDASKMLCEIAWDSTVHGYARQRASAALTEMGDEQSFDCLKRLSTETAVPAFLRHFALYAFGRRYASARADQAIPVLDRALKSSDEMEREKAIRALAYARPADALPILRAHLKVEKAATLVRIAQSRIEALSKTISKK